ncbi:MAG: O-antigen ligase family protein [Bacteroidota bacterium]
MSLANRIMVFLWGAIFITLLVKVPSLVDQFHVSRFVVASVFCVWGVLAVLPALKKVSLTGMDALLFAFYAWHLVSVLWADNFGEAIFASQKYLLFAILFLCFRQVLEEEKSYRDRIFPMIAACSILVCIVVLTQILQQLGAEGLADKGIYKIIGHAGHKNLTASYLFLMLGFLLYWLREHSRKPWYLLLLVAVGVLMLMLRSRAVFLAVMIGGFIYGLYLLASRESALINTYRRLLTAMFTVVLITFIGLIFTGIGKQYVSYINPMNYMESASATERLFVWSKTVDLIEDRPVLGYGAGNWKLFFPSKSIEGGYRLMEKDLVFTRTHNDFLEIAAEVGLPGLALYLGIFFSALIDCYRGFRKAKAAYRSRWVVLVIMLIGYMIISFFDFPKERIEHLTILALLLAFVFYQGKANESALTGRLRLTSNSARYGLSGILLLLLLINIPVGYHRFIGDQASLVILSNRGGEQLESIRRQVQRAESDWYDVDPMVVPLSWYEGVAHYVNNDYTAAEPRFAKAYDINPYNFNVVNNYASTLVQLKEYERAIPLYRQALEINPRFEDGMFNLAYSLFQLGEYNEALELVNKTTKNAERKRVFLQEIETAIQSTSN